MKKKYSAILTQVGSSENLGPVILDVRYKRPHIKQSPNHHKIVVGQQISRIKHKGRSFPYFTLNTIALSLKIVDESLGEIKNARNNIDAYLNDKNQIDSELITVLKENTEHLVAYIHAVQKGVIFSCSAFESFLNILIPDDIEWEEIDSKGVKNIYDKDSIKRWMTNRKKYEILDSVYKFKEHLPKPFEEQYHHLLEKYKALEKIRNNIVHQKDKDDEKIIMSMFRDDMFELVNSVFAIISCILPAITKPEYYELAMLMPIFSEHDLLLEISENYGPTDKNESYEFFGKRVADNYLWSRSNDSDCADNE